MSKGGEYRKEIMTLLVENKIVELKDMLIANSNLPGPRANLELANALCDSLKVIGDINGSLWGPLKEWSEITAEDTSINMSKEFIPFCALQALGVIYNDVDTDKKQEIIELFKNKANDIRWRIREAVAIGLQWIEEMNFNEAKLIINSWIDDSNLLGKRAIIAALAHPPVLKKKENVLFSIKVTEGILEDITELDKEHRRTEEFRVLKKGLDYAISVFVANMPNEGFEFLENWAKKNDPDIKKIIKSNIGKSRLSKKFSREVEEVKRCMLSKEEYSK